MLTPKLKRRFRRNREILRAAWRAFRYRTNIGAPVFREGIGFIKRVLARKKKRSPLKLWLHRVRSCRKCEIYNAANRTCGSNKDILEAGGRLFPDGCSCLVGVKASDLDAKCFLVSIGAPSMWAVNMVSLDGLGAMASHRPDERAPGSKDERGCRPADGPGTVRS